MCVHAIQFLCGHSTVIYMSITILHWWFCTTVKYPYGITSGGVWYQKRTNATHPFTRCGFVCFAVETVCDRHTETPVCRPVYHGVPENSSTKKSWHSVAGVFCFHIPFLQAMCSRSVYRDLWWHAALRQFRYQQGYCLILLFITYTYYTWHFCKWCRRIAHAGQF